MSDEEYGRVDFVKMLKYPIEFGTKSSLWYNGIFIDSDNPKLAILRAELTIFEMLSNRTGVVDGPYIPMLRYEMRVNRELFEQGEFRYALLRQHTLFETVFRLKAGLGQEKWRWTVESVYRGENLISKRMYEDFEEFNDMRNNLAHNWFYHLSDSDESVREITKMGLNLISRLLINELSDIFETYTNRHPSHRLYSKLEQRDTCAISSNANISVRIRCEKCEEKFNPQNHHKRCPHCYSPHQHWRE
ncbi:hypothetical protein [Halorubrum sp. LN27]|uniref:hypothetical protein n=1 Tax=Halorubrum sp. LN27 TaxID=2801032 RepID=UPI00190E0349|nr:hypothetical protein [Halorubrum sp. LN27]